MAEKQMDQERFKNQLSIRVTREGLYWLLAAALIWGIGMHRAINLFTLLASMMLAMLVLNLLLAGRRIRHLRLRRWHDDFVFALKPFRVHLEIENPRRRRLQGLRLEDRGPAHALVCYLPRIKGGEKAQFDREIIIPKRGWYDAEPVRACSGYPFGFAERRAVLGPRKRLLVFPALGRLDRGRLQYVLEQANDFAGYSKGRASHHLAAQIQFHGLRSFRSGDSQRLIHWRTSARRGELMVRQFEEPPNDNLILVLDPCLAPAAADRNSRLDLEEAISLTATICWEWCRRKGDRLVLGVAGPEPTVLDGETGPELAQAMLECLALCPEGSPSDEARLIDELARRKLPSAPVLLIRTGPGSPANALAQRLGRPVACLDLGSREHYDFYKHCEPRGSC